MRRERGWMMRFQEVVIGIPSRLLRSSRATCGTNNKSGFPAVYRPLGVDRRMVSPGTHWDEMYRLPAYPPALPESGNLDHLRLLRVRRTWEHRCICFDHILLQRSRVRHQRLRRQPGPLHHSVAHSRTSPRQRLKQRRVPSLRDKDICWRARTNRQISGDRDRIVTLHQATLVDRISPDQAWAREHRAQP